MTSSIRYKLTKLGLLPATLCLLMSIELEQKLTGTLVARGPIECVEPHQRPINGHTLTKSSLEQA